MQVEELYANRFTEYITKSGIKKGEFLMKDIEAMFGRFLMINYPEDLEYFKKNAAKLKADTRRKAMTSVDGITHEQRGCTSCGGTIIIKL